MRSVSSYTDQPIQRIAIIVAMSEEAIPIFKKLKMCHLKPETFGFNPQLGLKVSGANLKEKEVYLIENGSNRISVAQSAITTYAVIHALKPDLIISAGIARGLKDSEQGDVYISDSKIAVIDARINIPGFMHSRNGFNYFPIPDIAAASGLRLGVIASGSSLKLSQDDIQTLRDLKADVVDMSAAPVAEVSQTFDVKMVAVKVIASFFDTRSFEETHPFEAAKYAEKIKCLVSNIFDR